MKMTPIQSAGEAVPRIPTIEDFDATSAPEPEHPWLKARRIGKDLSSALDDCSDGRWGCHILPTTPEYSVFFASLDDEHPNQIVDRLAAALCEALDNYAGGRFHARIYPAA